MGKCKNCKWWGKYQDRVCDMVDHDYNTDDTAFEIDVTADDDQGLSVALITGPEFGCIFFESN
jgi:hypothetical protein